MRVKYVLGAARHRTSSLVQAARRASCAHSEKTKQGDRLLERDNAAIYEQAAGDCALLMHRRKRF